MIVEGLQKGDLEDLILPIVTIDEFESKIDDDAVVVGFYVKHDLAAKDLNRFIQKSAMTILDTEISPSANENGFYLVFVEILRNSETENKILSIIKNVSSLTNIEKWQFTYYKYEKVFELSQKNLHILLRTEPKEKKEETETVFEFFNKSNVHNLIIEGKAVSFGDHKSTHTFNHELYENFEEFSKEHDYKFEMNFKRDFDFMIENVQRIFGPEYSVYKSDNGYAVSNNQTGKMINLV